MNATAVFVMEVCPILLTATIGMSDDRLDRTLERAKDLQATGRESSHASQLAFLESVIEQWPPGWGEHFCPLIYGDFDPPERELVIEALGIVIEPTPVTNTVLRTPRTVLRARVMIATKSLASLKDAAARINYLCGVLSLTHHGAPIRWWSYYTNKGGGGVRFRLGDRDPAASIALIERLEPAARKKLRTALFWMREPRGLLFETHREDTLTLFAGYWNAFELLVEAADLVVPRPVLTADEKRRRIGARVLAKNGVLNAQDVQNLYREVVDPGFRAAATHALTVCFGSSSAPLLDECFEVKPKSQRLYQIRNEINHGVIDVDDPETRLRIDARLLTLQLMVQSLVTAILSLNHALTTALAATNQLSILGGTPTSSEAP